MHNRICWNGAARLSESQTWRVPCLRDRFPDQRGIRLERTLFYPQRTNRSLTDITHSNCSVDLTGDFYLVLSRQKRREENLIDMDDELTSKLDTVLHYRVQSLGEGRILVTFMMLGSPPPFVIENRTLHTFAFTQEGTGVPSMDGSRFFFKFRVLQSLAVPCQR